MDRTIRKGYADTPRGQLHYRQAGPETGPVLILMPWVPGSSRQYRFVLPGFAACGYRALALDLMGFGRSDRRAGTWEIADFAENVRHALAFLGIDRAFVLGGHFSAAVACQLALDDAGFVPKLILDGSPVWDEAGRAETLKRVSVPRPKIAPDGRHKLFPWERAVAAMKDWNPAFEVTDETLYDVYEMIIDYLEMRFDMPAPAVLKYGMRDRLPALAVPVLAMAAENERLRPLHEVVLAGVSDCRGHVFPGSHPLLAEERAGEYVAVVDAFLRGAS